MPHTMYGGLQFVKRLNRASVAVLPELCIQASSGMAMIQKGELQ